MFSDTLYNGSHVQYFSFVLHQFSKHPSCLCLSCPFSLSLSFSLVYIRVNVPFPSPSLLFVLLFFHLVFLSLFPLPLPAAVPMLQRFFHENTKSCKCKKKKKTTTKPPITTGSMHRCFARHRVARFDQMLKGKKNSINNRYILCRRCRKLCINFHPLELSLTTWINWDYTVYRDCTRNNP